MTNASQPMVGISSPKSPPGHCMLPKCLDQSHPGMTTSAVLILSLASWTCTTGLQFPHLTGVNSCAILSVFLEQWKIRQCFLKSCFPGSRQSLIQVPKLSPPPSQNVHLKRKDQQWVSMLGHRWSQMLANVYTYSRMGLSVESSRSPK